MKILFICPQIPYPPDRGGKTRCFNMVAHLGQKHSVVVASLAHNEEELKQGSALKNYCDELIVEVLPDSVRWLQAVKALATPTPSSVAYYWSPRLHMRIEERLQRTKFDAIFVHCAFAAQYVKHRRNPFRIIDFCDMDSAKWDEYSKWKRFPFSFGYRLESRKLRQYERDIALDFQVCAVTTQREKEEFDRLGISKTCVVLQNGVDANYFCRSENPLAIDPIIVFLGRMDYFPNVDGVFYFVDNILPLVRQRIPDVEFRIIGSNPSRRVQELGKIRGITVTGHVSDVRSYLMDAMVSVAPLRIARGTQTKILESMSMGIPVVATPQAAKGIEAVAGRDLMVADNPEAFADAVADLLKKAPLRKNLSEAGRKQVEKAHLWPASMDILNRLLAEGPLAATNILAR